MSSRIRQRVSWSILTQRLTCRGLEVACGVVALGDKNVVLLSALNRFIERDRWTHESHQWCDAVSEYRIASSNLLMRISVVLGDGRDDSNEESLGSDILSSTENGDVNV